MRNFFAICLLAVLAASASAAEGKPWKAFVLAGQSNMGGKAKISLLEYQANAPKTTAQFAHLKDGDGWKTRDDVFIKFRDKKGKLTVGYGYKRRME